MDATLGLESRCGLVGRLAIGNIMACKSLWHSSIWENSGVSTDMYRQLTRIV
ncbi:hypothetical protein ACLOJK_002885 [Asimina triloba]